MYRRAALFLLLPLALLRGGNPSDRDFSGKWILDAQSSDSRALPMPPSSHLTISQQGATVQCTEDSSAWSFRTDGTESNYRLNGADMSTETKWEGSALMLNTLVSGEQSYATMDRWELSKDHGVLKITRTVQRGGAEREAKLVYLNMDRAPAVPARSTVQPVSPSPAAPEFVIPAGTKIPLALVNTVSTKYSSEGDRVYLETVFPITRNGRIVIPRGSYVAGTLTEVKRATKFRGKGELYLRFDSLTLPNGITRDFRSRLDNADTGNVDRKEGKITGEGDKPGDVRKVGEAAGAGAGVGGIGGAIAGHPIMGVGIGAAGGAAAGLAGVLISKGAEVELQKGTTMEMVLDRPLRYEPQELVR